MAGPGVIAAFFFFFLFYFVSNFQGKFNLGKKWRKAPSQRKTAADEGVRRKTRGERKGEGLYLQVRREGAEAGGHLRQPQLGAIHREHDPILLAVALGWARGRRTWLRSHRLEAGRGGQEDTPEELLHPQRAAAVGSVRGAAGSPRPRAGLHPGELPGPSVAAGTVPPAVRRGVRMQPGKGRHC